jgi:hypothetical protein
MNDPLPGAGITEAPGTLLIAGETVRCHSFRYSDIDRAPEIIARSGFAQRVRYYALILHSLCING